MTIWKMTTSLVAVALCASATTLTTPDAHADEPADVGDEISTSEDALVSTPDDINVTPNHNDLDSRSFPRDDDFNRRSFDFDDGFDDRIDNRSFDRDWHRYGYRTCYAYCDDIRDACMRRYYRGGYDTWRGGGRHRWESRHRRHDGYRRCERRFDYCLDSCRNDRLRDR